MNERDLRLSDGRVRVVEAGAGPALVLLHGLGGSWRNWVFNVDGLAESHRVIALDLPGFGRSEPYSGAVTMERYVDTVVELLDLLGIGEATFVGNSLGGLLTVEAAARRPDRVHAAILVCSGGIRLTSLQRLRALPPARALSNLLRRPRSRRALTQRPRVRRAIARRLIDDPPAWRPD